MDNKFIDKPKDLLNKSMNDALVKVVTSEIPFLQKYFLNDISLKVRGPEEDKAYTFIEGTFPNFFP